MSKYERDLLKALKDKSCLFEHNGHIRCTHEFWTVINDIAYLAYVDYEEEDD